MKNKTELIRQAVDVLFSANQVIEVRALGNTSTYSGYFNDFNELVRRTEILDCTGDVNGIYFVLNELNPKLLARRANRIPKLGKKDNTTSDSDIIKRRWLPIDIDPIRPSGISSSDEEHKKALQKAEEVSRWLSEEGFPEPILADSGNGAHLLYKIDVDNTDESRHLIERFLEVLSIFHSDERCAIDTAVFNAARIWKLYGTMSRKGDNIPERPHRRAKIIRIPQEISTVPESTILKINSIIPEPVVSEKNNYNNNFQQHPYFPQRTALNLKDWLAANNIDIDDEKKWKDGTLYVLDQCPFSDAHKYGAYAIQFSNGAIHIACHHNSCGGNRNRWKELRERYGYQDSSSKFSSSHNGTYPKNELIEVIEPPVHEKESYGKSIESADMVTVGSEIIDNESNLDFVKDSILQCIGLLNNTPFGKHSIISLLRGVNLNKIDVNHNNVSVIIGILSECNIETFEQSFDELVKSGYLNTSGGALAKFWLSWKGKQYLVENDIFSFKQKYSSQITNTISDIKPGKQLINDESIARSILECVRLLDPPFGKYHIKDILQGKSVTKIKKYGHYKLPIYGSLRGVDNKIIFSSISRLIFCGYLLNGSYKTIIITSAGKQVLEDNNLDLTKINVLKEYNSDSSKAKEIVTPINNNSESLINIEMKKLDSPSDLIRESAAKKLGEIGDSKAVEPLIERLSDEISDVRVAAAVSLGNLKDHKAFESLVKTLNDSNSRVRFSAIDALVKLNVPYACQPLISCLEHNDSYTRSYASSALGELKCATAVEPLMGILKKDDDIVKEEAIISLGKIGDKRAFQPLLRQLESDKVNLMECAAEALGYLQDNRAFEHLVHYTKHQYATVRRGAIRGLGLLGNPEAIDIIIPALKDEYKSVRCSAAEALGNIGGAKAVQPLLEALNDKESIVRYDAAFSLGVLGYKVALGPLVQLLSDSDYEVRECVKYSIKMIEGRHK